MDSFVSSGIDGRGVFVIDDDGVCIDGRFFGYREIKTLSFAKEPDAQRVKATLRLETFKGSFEGYHILRDGQPTTAFEEACSFAEDTVGSQGEKRATAKDTLLLVAGIALPVITLFVSAFVSGTSLAMFLIIYCIAFILVSSAMGPAKDKGRRTSEGMVDYGVEQQGCIGGCLMAPVAAIVSVFEAMGDVVSAIGSSASLISKGDAKQITKLLLSSYFGALVFFLVVMVWPK